jgi:hypothetical protein
MTFTRLTRPTQICAAFALAAVLGLLAAPQAARAGDDDAFYNATFGRLMKGLGLQSADDEQGIKYRERAPLVIPPNHDLPPPEKTSAVPNPAWPKDPDVERRKEFEKMQKNRNVEAERMREENPLPPDQIAPGPRPRGGAGASPGPDQIGRVMSPSELGYKGGLFDKMFHGKNNDVAKFTGEPARTSLTEPPTGYQTPSPDQPYGTGQAPAPTADNNYLHRGELPR